MLDFGLGSLGSVESWPLNSAITDFSLRLVISSSNVKKEMLHARDQVIDTRESTVQSTREGGVALVADRSAWHAFSSFLYSFADAKPPLEKRISAKE